LEISPIAIITGTVFFALLFGLNLWLTWRYVHRLTAKKLLVGQKTSQRMSLRPSKVKAAVGAASLALGYTLALGFQNSAHSINIFPIVILVSVGTYFFFGQVLAVVLSLVRRRTTSAYTFLSASRLSHRIQDFNKIFTLVTLLCAGTLTLIGVALAAITHIRQIATSPDEYQQMIQVVSMILFVFFFIGLLFFVAAACALYVKLFTQLDEDRIQARSLERLGILPRNFQAMLWRELSIMLFMPAVIAVVHATVAMVEFTTKVASPEVSNHDAWIYFAGLVILFLAVFGVFYAVAGIAYGKQVQRLR